MRKFHSEAQKVIFLIYKTLLTIGGMVHIVLVRIALASKNCPT